MQNMIFDSVFEVDSVLENKSDFLIVADSILNKRIWNNQIEQWRRNAVGCLHLPTASISTFLEGYLFLYQNEILTIVANDKCTNFNAWSIKDFVQLLWFYVPKFCIDMCAS